MTDDGAVTITLPRPPTKPLSMNEAIGIHWGRYAKRMDPWRDEFTWLLKAHRKAIQAMEKPVTVKLTIRFKRGARRDNANFYPCVKSALDGAVHAGCLDDDSPAYVTVAETVCLYDPNSEAVTLTITPAPGVASA